MARWLTLPVFALVFVAAPASAAGLTGQYVEARTCDVWTGPCFANAEMNLTGKHAVLAWKIDKGTFENVRLDGLSVVAVVAASDTLGMEQTGAARAVLLVDAKATSQQREALIRLARRQGGDLVKNVVDVQTTAVDVTLCQCDGGACAKVQAGKARVETRCINDKHDKVCGNETAFYPPLARDVKVAAAATVEHSYSGTGFNETWSDPHRRGAYVGTFAIK
jgi:hypothetical protein